MGKVVKIGDSNAVLEENKGKEIGILIFADYNCATGFGNVAKQFVSELQKDINYRIVVHAINDFSKAPYQDGEQTLVNPARLNKEKDPYGRMQFLRTVRMYDFDLVFILNDVEVIAQMIPHLQIIKNKKREWKKNVFKTVAYFPIDSVPLKIHISELHKLDLPITYTQYAKKTVCELNPKLEDKIKILPHGVNLVDFFKIDNQTKVSNFKKMIFGKKNSDAFVFGSVNRNSARKDMACILLAFATFIKLPRNHERPILLYLHCNPKDPMGLNMERACERLGLTIGEDVFFPNNFNENTGFKINELNIRYNLIDVFISTTTAEGWGLTITEAMATKTPVICPLHTSLYEITKGGELVEPLLIAHESVFLSDFENVRYVCDPKELVNRCVGLFNALTDKESEDYQILNERTNKAFDFVSKLEWSDISKKFKELIEGQLS